MKRYLLLSAALILVLCLLPASGYHNTETGVFSEATANSPPPSPHESLPPSGTAIQTDTYSNTPGSITVPSNPSKTNVPKEADIQPSASPNEPSPESTPKPEKAEPIPDWYENKDKGIKVPILMYHNLSEGSSPGDGLNASQEVFDDHMYHLKAYGYNTITFDDLYDHYMYGSPLPENPVIITFDDGYRSNYTIGYPILKKYELKACIFVITHAIGYGQYMSKAEIKELSDSGIVDIQCHSVTHPYELSSLNKESMESEVVDSRNTLESITGKEVNIFCYPYGRYSQRLINVLKEQNYIFSVTTVDGLASKSSNPFLLSRIKAYGNESGKKLKDKIDKMTGRPTIYVGIPEPSETPLPEPTSAPGETPFPTEPDETPMPLELGETPLPSEPGETPLPEPTPQSGETPMPSEPDVPPSSSEPGAASSPETSTEPK